MPYEARKTKLELDEKNIYKFGMGFNASQTGDGNITNIVIKSRYTLLDLKCNKLEKYLRSFLKPMIQIALDEINEQYETNYTMKDVDICLEREIPTNEKDNAEIEKYKAETKQIEINIILDAASKLDDETIIRALCDILDIDYEEIKDKIEVDRIDLSQASQKIENVGVADE
ncbi:MAG: phage portal protein [Clostridia bacterium]|nr:phage portal protein [Clostridia bacterium]